MHRHIWLNARGWYDAMCFLCSVVCNSQHEPFVICLLYIVRGHPCMWALSFGEDVGGKSNVRRSASTSMGMRINQCVHIVFMSCIKLATIWHKKSVESSCCLFHTSRLLHCLFWLNRQRQSPRRYENHYRKETYIKHFTAPKRIQSMLTRSPRVLI